MNTEQVKSATLSQVLCSSVRLDNAQALADRYCDLTGITTWVVWSVSQEGSDRFCLLDQVQLNSLRLQEPLYRLIYCSDQPGKWLVPLEEIEPVCEYGHVQLTPAGKLRTQVVSEQFYNLNQSWNYERVVKVQDKKLRVSIRRNAYDFQSFIRGFTLDSSTFSWNCVVDRPITAGECQSESYVLSEQRVNRKLFESDADSVIQELQSIVF